MKKRKMNLKKLSLQKRTIASVETVQGGIKETQFIVICQSLINTNVLTVLTTTTQPPRYTDNPHNENCKITHVTCPTDCVKCF